MRIRIVHPFLYFRSVSEALLPIFLSSDQSKGVLGVSLWFLVVSLALTDEGLQLVASILRFFITSLFHLNHHFTNQTHVL
jgi:hypothetical protein